MRFVTADRCKEYITDVIILKKNDSKIPNKQTIILCSKIVLDNSLAGIFRKTFQSINEATTQHITDINAVQKPSITYEEETSCLAD